MAKRIRPFSDRVVVLPEEVPEQVTPSGIQVVKVEQERPQVGLVVAAGPGRVPDSGPAIPLPMPAKVGDRVLFGKFAGTQVELGGVKHLILREGDLFGLVEE